MMIIVMLWTGRSCRRRQCWLWLKRKRPQVPQVHQSCVRTRIKCSQTIVYDLSTGRHLVRALQQMESTCAIPGCEPFTRRIPRHCAHRRPRPVFEKFHS